MIFHYLRHQLIEASKKYTGATDEKEAIAKMKKVFESDSMWHGDLKFPANESDAHAHKTCTDDESARKYCPTRWKSVEKWAMVSPTCSCLMTFPSIGSINRNNQGCVNISHTLEQLRYHTV